jgi:glyoxalase family protein
VATLGETLQMEPEGAGRWLAWGERRHGLYVYDKAPAEPGRPGAGTVHHVAFGIREGEQDGWRDRVVATGLSATPILDRRMFKSIYFREPSGVLLELATDQPGFVFEPADRLGESLVLIGAAEDQRAELEQRFPLLPNPRSSTPSERSSG